MLCAQDLFPVTCTDIPEQLLTRLLRRYLGVHLCLCQLLLYLLSIISPQIPSLVMALPSARFCNGTRQRQTRRQNTAF